MIPQFQVKHIKELFDLEWTRYKDNIYLKGEMSEGLHEHVYKAYIASSLTTVLVLKSIRAQLPESLWDQAIGEYWNSIEAAAKDHLADVEKRRGIIVAKE